MESTLVLTRTFEIGIDQEDFYTLSIGSRHFMLHRGVRMDRNELESWILAHQAEIYRYVRYLGADSAALAEDLVQDTFLMAFKSLSGPNTNDERARAAWLRGIARNLFFNYCRRNKHNPVKVNSEALEQAEAVWKQDFLCDGDGFEAIEALRGCVGKLEEKQRGILDQFYKQEKSRAELAQLYKMSEDGVKSLMRRIRRDLAECIRRRLATGKAG